MNNKIVVQFCCPGESIMYVPQDYDPADMREVLALIGQVGLEPLDTMETGVEYDTDQHGRSVILLVEKGEWD